MQKYTLEKVSAPVTFLYYMIKIAEVFSEKYNLNLKENEPNFVFFF